MKTKDKFTAMILLAFLLSMFSLTCDAQSFTFSDNTYSAVATAKIKEKAKAEKTPYTWKCNDNKTYPIFISKSGSCYINKVSSKTGKEYRMYLKPEVSQDICKKMNREYKPRKKQS